MHAISQEDINDLLMDGYIFVDDRQPEAEKKQVIEVKILTNQDIDMDGSGI